MNNTTQKIRIDSLNASHTRDGKLQVWGSCTFQFYDRQEIKAASLAFTSYGNCAVTLHEAGVGAVAIAIGRVNTSMVEREGYKDKVASLAIATAEIIRTGSSQSMPVETVPSLPSHDAQRSAIAGNGKASLAEIPF
jgi:hypothetical protein